MTMENQGYKIVDIITTSDNGVVRRGFVLGNNPKLSSPWVTWRFKKEKDETEFNYFSGNYWRSERNAKRDFYQRVSDSYADY